MDEPSEFTLTQIRDGGSHLTWIFVFVTRTTQLHFTTRANKNQLHKNTFTYLRPNNNNNNNNNKNSDRV